MMETIRIRQQGYSSRQLHADFFKRYQPIVPSCRNLRELVDVLSSMLSVSAESWQVGTTKLFIKRALSEKLDRLLWLRFTSSSRLIQRAWTSKQRHESARKVQSIVRRFVASRRYRRVRASVLKAQTFYRSRRTVRTYAATLRKVVKIQSLFRGKAGRILARHLHNPYNRMNYEQLSEALANAESELEAAFAKKDFASCDALEIAIKDIETARSKLPLPDVVPTNRRELELLTLEANYAIEYAEEKSNEDMKMKFEGRLKLLDGYKHMFPTLEETKAMLAAANTELEQAMSKKEFKRCAALQDRVAQCEKMVQDAMTLTADSGRVPIVDLQKRKAEIEEEIASCVAAKKFDRVSII
jgi:myosin heavy subunit